MDRLKINRFYIEHYDTPEDLELEFDKTGVRPAWIHIKTSEFKPRFISIITEKEPEIVYRRFTGNFYYPVKIEMNPEDEEKFYAEFSQYYDEFTMKNNLPMAQFILNKLKEFNVFVTARILDLGAGTGIFSDLAARNGYQDLTLVDISMEMLNVARRKETLKSAEFINSDVRHLNLKRVYDVIVSIMMFDAISDLELPPIVKNLSQHLAQNGYFFEIEDKNRDEYQNSFSRVDSGLLSMQEGKLKKFYFIGRKF